MAQVPETLNQLIKQFNDYADDHKQINGNFGFGELWEVDALRGLNGVTLWVAMEDAEVRPGELRRTFSFYVFDFVNLDRNNLNDVWSDTQLIILDLFSWMRNVANLDGFVAEKTATITHFVEKFDPMVAGWFMRLTLITPYATDRCAIPD